MAMPAATSAICNGAAATSRCRTRTARCRGLPISASSFPVGPEDSFAIMDRAHAEGINYVDSANVYGWGENRGLTERKQCTRHLGASEGARDQRLAPAEVATERS